MTPAMTEGGKLPFMFSQSQQIHARSWVPLQDTPQVRFTYTAHVTSPADVMVLMSADNDPEAGRDGDYSFKLPQAIPSYLDRKSVWEGKRVAVRGDLGGP